MYNHSDTPHERGRGRGPRRHRRRMFFTHEGDTFNLGPRLSYLTMLMRRSDAGRHDGGPGGSGRHGGGPGRPGGFRGQGRVLHVLGMRSPISQKELAYVLGIRSQSLAELVSKLEASGMITRTPDPSDRRTSLLELTEAGREAVESHKDEPEIDPFALLDDEEKSQLAALLDRVIAQLEQSLPGGPDPRMQRFKEMAFAPTADDSADPEDAD